MIIYPNGETWYAGQFNSIEDANKWANEEKNRQYWQEDYIIEITEQV
jgi:hypothetical protein